MDTVGFFWGTCFHVLEESCESKSIHSMQDVAWLDVDDFAGSREKMFINLVRHSMIPSYLSPSCPGKDKNIFFPGDL